MNTAILNGFYIYLLSAVISLSLAAVIKVIVYALTNATNKAEP